MARFAVVLTDEAPSAEEAISARYEKTTRLTDDVFIISADTTVSAIMDALGIEEEDSQFDGIVFSLNGSYGGRGPRRFWDWLENN